jgi:hypothetical protein
MDKTIGRAIVRTWDILFTPVRLLLQILVNVGMRRDGPIRKIVLCPAYMKLMVIFGLIHWTDVSFLHNPIMFLRICLEEGV